MSLKPFVSSENILKLRQAADIIVEVDEKITYLGYCEPKLLGTNAVGWSIMKIEQSNPGAYPNTTKFLWAEGTAHFNLIFDNYATYQYKFKQFK